MLEFFICVICAKVWQFAASMLYVQSNALFSCIFANREWHHYALERKPLHVTEPYGLQRSSYYISMPWRFGIPLMSSSAVLHWTLSQSVFVMVVEAVAEDGTIDHPNPEYFTGFSVWSIVVCKWRFWLSFPCYLLFPCFSINCQFIYIFNKTTLPNLP
jgi:hypothetical protein